MKDFLKDILGFAVEKRLENSHNVSSELMKQCVRQDKTPFDERKLDSLDPRYKKELLALVDKLVPAELNAKEGARIVIDLADGMRPKSNSFEDRKKFSNAIDNTSNLDTAPNNLTNEEIRYDLARSLGHVEVSYGKNGVTITDEFDFKGSEKSTSGLIYDAAYQKMVHGSNTGMLTSIGRVFCKEEDGKPTDSSIPIKININLSELGTYAPPYSPASINSAPAEAKKR